MIRTQQLPGSLLAVALFSATLLPFPGPSLLGQEQQTVPEFTAEQLEAFETNIRPLLVKHCYECHSTDSKSLKGGLLVDSREGLLKGGDSGTAIVPGKPEDSLLISSVKYQSYEMPPAGKLTEK